jgi:hypothetical protein
MEQLNSLPIMCKKSLIDMSIFTATFFLSTEVGELAKIWQVWHKQMAKQNPSMSRPVSVVAKGSARIHLTQMCKRLCELLKAQKYKGPVQQGESRQVRSCIAKNMDPRNKGVPTKKVRAGNTVAKEPRSASSGFSLTPELRISSAAVEAVKNNPKVTGKEDGRVAPGQGCGQEGDVSRKMASTPEAMGNFVDASLTSSHQVSCGPFDVLYGKDTLEAMEKLSQQQGKDHHNPQKSASRDQLRISTPEAMANIVPQVTSHQSCSEFFQNLHDGNEFATDVVTMGGPVERPIKIHTLDLVLEFFLAHGPFDVSLQDAMAIILKRSQDQTFLASVEWDNFIKQDKGEVMIEEAMV